MQPGALTLAEAQNIAISVAEALNTAQLHGITHRDLKKTSNVVFSGTGVKVLDFSLPEPKQSYFSDKRLFTKGPKAPCR
jgi:serine/threonine protein kinase